MKAQRFEDGWFWVLDDGDIVQPGDEAFVNPESKVPGGKALARYYPVEDRGRAVGHTGTAWSGFRFRRGMTPLEQLAYSQENG